MDCHQTLSLFIVLLLHQADKHLPGLLQLSCKQMSKRHSSAHIVKGIHNASGSPLYSNDWTYTCARKIKDAFRQALVSNVEVKLKDMEARLSSFAFHVFGIKKDNIICPSANCFGACFAPPPSSTLFRPCQSTIVFAQSRTIVSQAALQVDGLGLLAGGARSPSGPGARCALCRVPRRVLPTRSRPRPKWVRTRGNPTCSHHVGFG